MAGKNSISYGISSFKFKKDGEASMREIGLVRSDTAVFTADAPTVNDFFAQQNPDYPAISIAENAGISRINFSLMQLKPEVLQTVFGGTITGEAPNESYSAPRQVVQVYGACEITTETNDAIIIPSVLLSANFNWTMSRTDISNIDVVLTIQLPDDGTSAPYKITPAP
jgi:hypothetical protein